MTTRRHVSCSFFILYFEESIMKSLCLVALFLCQAVWANSPISDKSVAFLADKVAQYQTRKSDKLLYRDVKVLEDLLYKQNQLQLLLNRDGEINKRYSLRARLQIDLNENTLVYKLGKQIVITVKSASDRIVYSVKKRKRIIEQGEIELTQLSDEFVEEVRKEVYQLVLKSRGYSTLQVGQSVALRNHNPEDAKINDVPPREIQLRMKERMYNASKSDSNRWEYVPVKLIAYPFQKIMYDIPDMITSTATESVTRSPLHNLQGAGDEFKGAGLGMYNSLRDIVRGIFNPKRATAMDGVLGLLDSGIKVIRGGLGVAKSGVSLIGYPLYRLAGGKKSQRTPLRGKRASIVIIDTGIDGGIFDKIIDSYGESIVRNQLKSISTYYCMNSSSHERSIYSCIDNMPDNIQYVDFFALTHTGGDYDMEQYAQYAARVKGVKPELMVSIGCYDDPSTMTERENTLGQQDVSWAVHYYLSNVISKRLRGIPLPQAANESFYEGFASNALNPVSWGGYAGVSMMEQDITMGYLGSTPDVYDDETIIKNAIQSAWNTIRLESSGLNLAYSYKPFDQQRIDKVHSELDKIILLDQVIEEHGLSLKKRTKKELAEAIEMAKRLKESLDLFQDELISERQLQIEIQKMTT